jgi:hypothetical protein
MKQRHAFKWWLRTILIASGCLLGLALAIFQVRERHLHAIYRQAIRLQADPEIVARLATYKGSTSTALLLRLAHDPDIEPEIRVAAIHALSARNDEYVSDSVASLLQPHTPLNVREPTAIALQNMKCGDICVGAILHYLERQYRGDLDFELLQPLSPNLQIELDQNRKNVTQLLRDKLSKEPETFTILTNVYGLGTSTPSPFAIAEAGLLSASDACRLLHESHDFFVRAPNPARARMKQQLGLQMSRSGCGVDVEK